MACGLSYSFALDCKNSKGGIKKIWFAAFPADGLSYSPTVTSSIITSWTGAASKFYKYEVRSSVATGGDKLTGNKQNGTTFYATSLTLQLEKVYAAAQVELYNLAQQRILAIVLDRNGKYFLMGYNNGLDITEISAEFGTAMGDFNGYKLTLAGEEETFMYEINSSIISSLIVT